MFCRFCGKQIPEGAEFCDSCGKAQSSAATQEPKRKSHWLLWTLLGFALVGAIDLAHRKNPPLGRSPGTQATAGAEAPKTPSPDPGWLADSTTSAMENSKKFTMWREGSDLSSLGGDRPKLVLICEAKQTKLAVATGDFIQPEYGSGYSVRLRIDDGKPYEEIWDGATNYQALLSRSPIALARKLARAEIFYFEFTPFQKGKRQLSFDVTDFKLYAQEIYAKEFAEACGWKLK